jgi:dipeptidyl-peptidase-4
MKRILIVWVVTLITCSLSAQPITWSRDGNSYYKVESNEIAQYVLPANTCTVRVSAADLTPPGGVTLNVRHFSFSEDEKKVLVFTNTKRVWRTDGKGDYWYVDLAARTLTQLGKGLPPSSMMFAKFSPDGTRVAYVSEYNVYVEELATGRITALTKDGNRRFINGTFDWVYEEEFSCRDGIRWSPDSKSVAYWQVDARGTRDFFMINNTDSIYSQIIPVEYPKVGEDPSACRVGIADINTSVTRWIPVPGDPRQHYIVRAEFVPGTNDLILQQLNRKQNESKLIRWNAAAGTTSTIYTERDEAWIDVLSPGENTSALDFRHKIEWLAGGKEFLWLSEKSGWRHLYRITLEGTERPVTSGAFDVITFRGMDKKGGSVYYLASPQNATQQYLYRSRLDGKGAPVRVSPTGLEGTHTYTISPSGRYASHAFTNVHTRRVEELVSLPDHKSLVQAESIAAKLEKAQVKSAVEFFKVKTSDGVEMDGWIRKPENFDPANKYPVLFYVYTEPWGQNVVDAYGVDNLFLYKGNFAQDGYIYISIDNRGTPVPKGREWRKSVYRKIGVINIQDQANAAKEILKWPFIDSGRVAVWGWSGGGSATLNLMFQYPEIYKTGIAVAAVANQLTYDNIYQERYMGLPQENLDDFVKGSPVTYAKNLQGNLLYIHGTADDNVHYQNAEILINELVKYNKQFTFMSYPNRSHGMAEGEGTYEHLSTLFTDFLRKHCPPGGR